MGFVSEAVVLGDLLLRGLKTPSAVIVAAQAGIQFHHAVHGAFHYAARDVARAAKIDVAGAQASQNSTNRRYRARAKKIDSSG